MAAICGAKASAMVNYFPFGQYVADEGMKIQMTIKSLAFSLGLAHALSQSQYPILTGIKGDIPVRMLLAPP